MVFSQAVARTDSSSSKDPISVNEKTPECQRGDFPFKGLKQNRIWGIHKDSVLQLGIDQRMGRDMRMNVGVTTLGSCNHPSVQYLPYFFIPLGAVNSSRST